MTDSTKDPFGEESLSNYFTVDTIDKIANCHHHPDNFYNLTSIDNNVTTNEKIKGILEFLIKNYNENDYDNLRKWLVILQEQLDSKEAAKDE